MNLKQSDLENKFVRDLIYDLSIISFVVWI